MLKHSSISYPMRDWVYFKHNVFFHTSECSKAFYLRQIQFVSWVLGFVLYFYIFNQIILLSSPKGEITSWKLPLIVHALAKGLASSSCPDSTGWSGRGKARELIRYGKESWRPWNPWILCLGDQWAEVGGQTTRSHAPGRWLRNSISP